MPRKRKSRGDDDDGDDEAGKQSSTQQAGAEQLADLTEQTKEDLVKNVFRLVLFRHTKREPVTNADIKKLAVSEDYKQPVRDYVIRKVMERFEQVCGFEMVEVKNKKGKFFILQASSELLKSTTWDKEDDTGGDPATPEPQLMPEKSRAAVTGLLSAIISMIVLSKGEIKKEDLWKLLEELGVEEGDKAHPQLGNVKDCFEQFKRQLYIEEQNEKQNTSDRRGKILTYRLGARAHSEFVRPNLQQFLDGTYGEPVEFEVVDPNAEKEAEGEGA